MPVSIADDLPSLLAYNRWADSVVIKALQALSPEDYTREPVPGWPSIRSTVVHAADAMNIWARRLEGQTPSARLAEADVPTLADAERLLQTGQDAFDRILAASTPERLASTWSYVDLQGATHSLPLWSVFRHVVNHASYHRGQVASKLKRLGVEPPSTDLIVWARRPVE
jgi:uncharacterized damage-inducible protein DinB